MGEFYETMGTDAVLLVQHAGLNAMGQGDPPRAGCPISNLRRTVSDLVEQAGLSVVMPLPPFCLIFHPFFYSPLLSIDSISTVLLNVLL